MLIYGFNNKLINETNSFGAWLKMALANSEMTQTELARRLKMSQTSVSDWANNNNKPCWPIVKMICDIVEADAGVVWEKWF